jgi:hypothetical protein
MKRNQADAGTRFVRPVSRAPTPRGSLLNSLGTFEVIEGDADVSKENPGEHHNAEKLLPIIERDYRARIDALQAENAAGAGCVLLGV